MRGFIESGVEFKNKNGYKAKVEEYISWDNVIISFPEGEGSIRIRSTHLKSGNFKSPFEPTVSGVGYLGIGKYKVKYSSGELTPEYKLWVNMIRRCYEQNPKFKVATYLKVFVCDSWKNFQMFAEWCRQNEYFNVGYSLDKDLLSGGNKVYSPETCCFIPQSINIAISNRKGNSGVFYREDRRKYSSYINKFGKRFYLGCYEDISCAKECFRKQKESYIKQLADLWFGNIETRVYDALYKWEVVDEET